MPHPWNCPSPPEFDERPEEAPVSRFGWLWIFLTWLVVMTGLVIAINLARSTPVKAHSWYEGKCCSDRDCEAVPEGVVEQLPDGSVKVQGTIKGKLIRQTLAKGDSRLLWSKDYEDHACVGLHQENWLLCVYRKPNGT
jgi:hypothetical protein